MAWGAPVLCPCLLSVGAEAPKIRLQHPPSQCRTALAGSASRSWVSKHLRAGSITVPTPAAPEQSAKEANSCQKMRKALEDLEKLLVRY